MSPFIRGLQKTYWMRSSASRHAVSSSPKLPEIPIRNSRRPSRGISRWVNSLSGSVSAIGPLSLFRLRQLFQRMLDAQGGSPVRELPHADDPDGLPHPGEPRSFSGRVVQETRLGVDRYPGINTPPGALQHVDPVRLFHLWESAADDHPEGVVAGVGDVDVAAGVDRHGGRYIRRQI